MRIRRNSVSGYDSSGDPLAGPDGTQQDAGIYLQTLDRSVVSVLDDRVANRVYGVRARQLSASVTWIVDGLVTRNVDDAVYYDRTVQTKPR